MASASHSSSYITPASPIGLSPKVAATTVNHTRLTSVKATSIRVFFRLFDQYDGEVEECARQLVAENIVSSEVVILVHLK